MGRVFRRSGPAGEKGGTDISPVCHNEWLDPPNFPIMLA